MHHEARTYCRGHLNVGEASKEDYSRRGISMLFWNGALHHVSIASPFQYGMMSLVVHIKGF